MLLDLSWSVHSLSGRPVVLCFRGTQETVLVLGTCPKLKHREELVDPEAIQEGFDLLKPLQTALFLVMLSRESAQNLLGSHCQRHMFSRPAIVSLWLNVLFFLSVLKSILSESINLGPIMER